MKHSLLAAAFAVLVSGNIAVLGAVTIPAGHANVSLRNITIADIASLRSIDSLSVSPDGKQFAILVRQGDPVTNVHHSAWFVGEIQSGKLVPVGDGGELRADALDLGWVSGRETRWSPDGQWIAYRFIRNSEVHLWRSRVDGSVQEQITHNAADVGDFAWSEDGTRLFYRVGRPRAEIDAEVLMKEQGGYQYDEDLGAFTDLMKPKLRPEPGIEHVWVVDLSTGQEHLGDEMDRMACERLIEVQKEKRIDSQSVRTPGDVLGRCVRLDQNKLLCIRQTQTRPWHVAEVDTITKAVREVLDVNPEFQGIRLGKVEPIDWDPPDYPWNQPGEKLAGLVDIKKKVSGYILYPPDFDPHKKYPVFISPYVAGGFDHGSRWEQPLQVYAAHGFVVLNFSFPSANNEVIKRLGNDVMKEVYSLELGFPHLSLYLDSTLKGLDLVAMRGFIDQTRVGIGGMSHGTFVPLYMLQKQDRISAISISSIGWGPFSYYWNTRTQRKHVDWLPKPDAASAIFYEALDIADNVDEVEAPILMNLADVETFGNLRLIRHLDEAEKPYDVWVYSHEDHIKSQPAHLYSIMNRNLDWFRFWLQDYDPTTLSEAELREKGDWPLSAVRIKQYEKWRKLRVQQAKNHRSLRNYSKFATGSEKSVIQKSEGK